MVNDSAEKKRKNNELYKSIQLNKLNNQRKADDKHQEEVKREIAKMEEMTRRHEAEVEAK